MPDSTGKIPVMVLSLDNVIVDGDSLSKLASSLRSYGLRHGKLRLVKRIYTLSSRRNNQDISHRRFKFELIRTLRNLKKPEFIENFAQKVADSFKPEVKRLMDKFKSEGGKVAVVTAAPSEYAVQIANKIGADHIIATPSLSEFRRKYPHDPIDYEECAGHEKISRLEEWLEKINGYIHTVVSGEPDELPLILLPDIDSIFIASNSKSMRRTLKRQAIFFETIH